MPLSTYLQITPILDHVMKLNPVTVLDVGCGIGVYGALCRIYLEGDNLYDRVNLAWNPRENWRVTIDCIEGFQKYLTDLHRAVYNQIRVGNALEVLKTLPDKAYDLVLAIDILEHFEKQDGEMFLREVRRVGKSAIIATPSEFMEQTVPENPLEDHRSVWTEGDLQRFGICVERHAASIIGILRDDTFSETRSVRSVVVRPFKNGDEDGIRSLFREVFGREMSREEWQWKYRGHGADEVYVVVVEGPDGRIVGHYGGVPLRMQHGDTEIRGLTIADVMIHPKSRGLKNFKAVTHMMEDHLYRQGFKMVYGFPNEKSLLTPGERLGLFERVEEAYEGYKEVSFHNSPNRFIYRLFPLSYDDERIDALWETAKRDMVLAVIRDRKYLSWRYANHPLHAHEVWGLRKRWSRRLSGLAILKRESEGRALLMDFVVTRGRERALIEKVENLLYRSRWGQLHLWIPPHLASLLEKMGYTVVPTGTTIPCTTHPGFLKKADIEGKFFYTFGDADTQ